MHEAIVKYPRAGRPIRCVIAGFALFGLGLASCSSQSTGGSGAPPPVDAGADAEGSAGSGGMGGVGGVGGMAGAGGAGGMGNPQPVCPDAFRRCAHPFTLADTGQTSVELRGSFAGNGWTVGIPMVKQGGVWTATAQIPYDATVQYKFVVNGSNWITDPANPLTVDDGFGGFVSVLQPVTCASYTCLPAWQWRQEVLYQIVVDRFANGDASNDGAPLGGVDPAASYQGGDWKGVQSKIDDGYLSSLGVTALVLTVPVDNFEGAETGGIDPHSYSAYHGNWPKDLLSTEEHFGTMDELKQLVAAAHAKDMKVVLEYTANHVHLSAPIYQQHPNWFWPNDNGAGGNCVCGEGCSWNPPTGEKCWFKAFLPDFNYTNAAARTYSIDTILAWIQQTNIDGLRLHATRYMPQQWLTELRTRIHAEVEPMKGAHFFMLGDAHGAALDAALADVNSDTMLDGNLEASLRAAILSKILMRQGTMQELVSVLDLNDAYAAEGVLGHFMGAENMPRSIHFAQDVPVWSDPWDSGQQQAWPAQLSLPSTPSAFERLASAFTFFMTTQGLLVLYYGDEIGMPGAGSPDNHRFMTFTGLSAAQLALRTHLSRLGQIRKEHPAAQYGKRTIVKVTTDTMVYKLVSTSPADTLYVAINRSDQPQAVNGLPNAALTNLLDGQMVTGPSVMLPPRSSMVLTP